MNERHVLYFIGFVLACYLIMLGMVGMAALASATPERPDPAAAHGCAVLLTDTMDDAPSGLVVRTTRPISECDGGAPVAWGASVLDGYAGGRR